MRRYRTSIAVSLLLSIALPASAATVRKMLWIIAILAFPFALSAQTNHTSWSNLSGLEAGQSIQIVDTASNKHSGTFVSVSDTAISYRANNREQSIQRQDVHAVKLIHNKHRVRNTLVGAGIGAGAGAGLTAASWESHGFLGSKGTGAAVGAVIGGLTGTMIGAVWPSHAKVATVYDVNSN